MIFKKKLFEERGVSLEKYLDLAITEGFGSLRETALTKNLNEGLQVLEFAGYQAEVLARAKGFIKLKDDPLLVEDYSVALEMESKNLINAPPDLVSAMLAVFKIAYVIREFELDKPIRKEMKT